jgi:hypothetical protein
MNMKMRLLTLIVIVLVILGAFPFSASASHAWGNYHWARTSNPFTLLLGDNMSSDWDPYLGVASSDWSASSVLDTVITGGSTTGRQCRPTVGRVEVCNAKYGRNGWLGVAQIWISGDHITQGTTKMNDTYFSMAKYNTPAERQHVVCQEIGHTFGLGHQDESGAALGTCMDYSQSDGSQHPNQHDYDQLETIYAHLDSTSTVGSMPADMANGDFEAPGAWGRLVSANARTAIYERDFGGGFRIFTFVYLAW